MFSSIRSRLIVIGLLIAGSVYFLFPRTVTLRVRGADGVMHDDTVTRVPLKRGLDLQGGMHLALELDQSKQVSADPKKDLDLALTVLRKRIDEFGVSEPVIQKVGNERLVVDLVQVFTGDAAVRAAIEDGMDRDAAQVRDTYVRNQNDRLRTVEMASNVRLHLLGACDSTGREELFSKLIKDANYGDLFYYTLGVQGGVVQRIDEHQAQPAC